MTENERRMMKLMRESYKTNKFQSVFHISHGYILGKK